ncbi:hypothetical protein [Hymenobacter arizonensis]|nr:hypothetical protein [Hymenobacter arizonensis]
MKSTVYCLFGALFALTSACKKEPVAFNPEACSAPFVAPVLADAYRYPLRPGTAAWAQLRTGQQMLDTCQLPPAVLATISTPGLVETCLEYPLLPDIFARTVEYHGMQSLLQRFNGLVELQRRPDAAAVLLARYQRMGAGCVPPTGQAAYSFAFGYVEYWLAHEPVVQQLSAAQRRDLVREAVRKYDAKKPRTDDVYGVYGLKTAVFVMARVLHAARYAPFEAALAADPALGVFLAEANIQGRPQLLAPIVEQARKFQ